MSDNGVGDQVVYFNEKGDGPFAAIVVGGWRRPGGALVLDLQVFHRKSNGSVFVEGVDYIKVGFKGRGWRPLHERNA